MGIDLVIFDCDGVLMDSEPVGNDAVRSALREFGLDADEIEREVFGRYFGKGLSDAMMWERIESYLGTLPDGIHANQCDGTGTYHETGTNCGQHCPCLPPLAT